MCTVSTSNRNISGFVFYFFENQNEKTCIWYEDSLESDAYIDFICSKIFNGFSQPNPTKTNEKLFESCPLVS